jgi:hypothetical protein
MPSILSLALRSPILLHSHMRHGLQSALPYCRFSTNILRALLQSQRKLRAPTSTLLSCKYSGLHGRCCSGDCLLCSYTVQENKPIKTNFRHLQNGSNTSPRNVEKTYHPLHCIHLKDHQFRLHYQFCHVNNIT